MAYRVGETPDKALAVEGGIVLEKEALGTFRPAYEYAHREHRRLGGELLAGKCFPSYPVIFEQSHLIGHHHLWLESIVGRDLGEGIILMCPCLREDPVGFLKVIGHFTLSDVTRECKRVHEHAHRVGDPEVGAPVAHGAHEDLLAGAEGSERKIDGSKAIARRRYSKIYAALCDIHPKGNFQRSCGAGPFGLLLVGKYGTCGFESLHPVPEERSGGIVVLSSLRSLLCGGIVEVGIAFPPGCRSVDRRTELAHEHVQGAAVENQMMEIAKEEKAARAPHYLSPEQRPFR